MNAAAERNLPLYIHSMSEPEHHIALDMKPHALVHAGFFEGEPSTLLLDRMKESGVYVMSTISVADAGRVFAQPELLKAPHVQLTVPVAETKTAADPKSAAGLQPSSHVFHFLSGYQRSFPPGLLEYCSPVRQRCRC